MTSLNVLKLLHIYIQLIVTGSCGVMCVWNDPGFLFYKTPAGLNLPSYMIALCKRSCNM